MAYTTSVGHGWFVQPLYSPPIRQHVPPTPTPAFRPSSAARHADHYYILGVDRNATEAEIKASYRKLARKYHPDVNATPSAVDIFYSISRAFEVLGDPERRQEYDDTSYSSSHNNTNNKSHQPSQPDLHIPLTLSLAEAVLGVQKTIRFLALSPCIDCKGIGGAPGGRTHRCRMCRGRGDITKNNNNVNNNGNVIACPLCDGRGILIVDACTKCQGRGVRHIRRDVRIDIPPGVDHRHVITVVSQGHIQAHTGRGSGSRNPTTTAFARHHQQQSQQQQQQGQRGNVFVHISVAENNEIRRKGRDLYSDVSVPLVAAILGGTVTVPVVTGELESLDIPRGTHHGATIALQGQGCYHYFRVRVEIPRKLSEQQQQVVLQLQKL